VPAVQGGVVCLVPVCLSAEELSVLRQSERPWLVWYCDIKARARRSLLCASPPRACRHSGILGEMWELNPGARGEVQDRRSLALVGIFTQTASPKCAAHVNQNKCVRATASIWKAPYAYGGIRKVLGTRLGVEGEADPRHRSPFACLIWPVALHHAGARRLIASDQCIAWRLLMNGLKYSWMFAFGCLLFAT